MKKLSIILVAMVLIAMTACKKEKTEQGTDNKAQTEQVDKNGPKISPDVKKAAPTEDGEDHMLCEFNTKEYQIRLENMADGTFRLSMWKVGQDKSETPEQVVNCKKAVSQGQTYVMDDGNGKQYMITGIPGKESIYIVEGNKFVYQGKGVK